jgi:hypothetical protein
MTTPRNTMNCPHCHARMRTITSRQLSALVREIYFDCMNVDCCHRCVAQLGIVRTLVPSLMPRADVSLPIVQRRANDIIVLAAPPEVAVDDSATPSTGAKSPHYAPMVLN